MTQRYNRYKKLPIQADQGVYVGTIPTQVMDEDGIIANKLPIGELKTVSVSLTAAQIIAMYTTAVEIVPAVTGKSIYVESVNLDVTGTATQFTGGGVVGVQYKNTANGAGTLTHGDIAASIVQDATALVHTFRTPVVLSAVATADIVGQGLFISNKTAVFAAGTGTAVVTVRYYAI